MKRRAFLGTIGIGIAATTGCISQADASDQSPNEGTDTTTENTQMSEPKRVPSGETRKRTLGEGTLSDDGARNPHGIVFDNPTAERWTGRLVIRRPDDSVALDETYELESETKVVVTLTDPLRYTAEVSIPETGASETVDVELAWFDCNASSTSFTIKSDGQLETGTISTLIACMNVETERISTGEEKSLSLGDGSLPDDDRKPHGVTLANSTEKTQTVRLVIEREKDVLLDGLYTLESEATVAVTFTEVGHYQGTVSVPTAGTAETFAVESDQFDCNSSATNVTVGSDGGLDVKTISTAMGCPSDEGSLNETSNQ